MWHRLNMAPVAYRNMKRYGLENKLSKNITGIFTNVKINLK